MNQPHRTGFPRHLEAYSKLFISLGKAFEQRDIRLKKKKSRKLAAKERHRKARERLLASIYLSVEEKAREFSLTDLEQVLLEYIRNTDNESEPVILMKEKVYCGHYAPYFFMAKAFRVPFASRLTRGEKRDLIMFVLCYILSCCFLYLAFCQGSSCANLVSTSLVVVTSGVLALVTTIAAMIFGAICANISNLDSGELEPTLLQIRKKECIRLPELRLLFVELKLLHLAPRLSISVDHNQPYFEVILEISPRWDSLKSFLSC
jgi:hypothetical protein